MVPVGKTFRFSDSQQPEGGDASDLDGNAGLARAARIQLEDDGVLVAIAAPNGHANDVVVGLAMVTAGETVDIRRLLSIPVANEDRLMIIFRSTARDMRTGFLIYDERKGECPA